MTVFFCISVALNWHIQVYKGKKKNNNNIKYYK